MLILSEADGGNLQPYPRSLRPFEARAHREVGALQERCTKR